MSDLHNELQRVVDKFKGTGPLSLAAQAEFAQILHAAGVPRGRVQRCLAQLPQSGIRRRGTRTLLREIVVAAWGYQEETVRIYLIARRVLEEVAEQARTHEARRCFIGHCLHMYRRSPDRAVILQQLRNAELQRVESWEFANRVARKMLS